MPGEIIRFVAGPIAEHLRAWHPEPVAMPLTAPQKALVRALRRIRFGRLRVELPDGKVISFKGRLPGESAQLEIRDWKAVDAIIHRGQIGFADAYVDGRIETGNLADLIAFFLRNEKALQHYIHGRFWYSFWIAVRHAVHGNLAGRRKVAGAHYELNNDFYALWLDEGMTYSSALFDDDPLRSLEEAQAAKYRRILKKLGAKAGDHVLEIGCGWGGFAEAAARLGLKVTAVTLSHQQADFAVERIEAAHLSDRVHILVKDYRDVHGTFDHVVSIGLFEHLGAENWVQFLRQVRRRLKPSGRALIQSIFVQDDVLPVGQARPDFTATYISPAGDLPSAEVFRQRAEEAGLACKEQFAFGLDYKKTFQCWLSRFEANLDAVRAQGHDEPFIRLWRLYLSSCIAAFATLRTSVMQAELVAAQRNVEAKN